MEGEGGANERRMLCSCPMRFVDCQVFPNQ